MRKLISLVLVLLVAGALAAWASGGIGRHHAGHTSGPSVAAIADTSTSWAEFSAKVPNLQDALTQETR
ncbi:MAG: hypothetical protein ACXVZP_10640 [Gaiellaceae bacterium]